MATPAQIELEYLLKPSNQATQHIGKLERSLVLKDNFSGPLGRISNSFAQFDRSLDASNARVLAFGASAGLILGVQRAFSGLVRETISVQKAFQEINVIFGLTSKNLTAFGDSLFDVAKQTGQRFNVVAEAAKELSRQGLSATETLKRTRDALILTRQSGLDAEASVKAITSALNSFNKESLTSTEVINKLANVDAKFAVSSKDLADAISRTGSSASEAGVSFNELIGLVTAAQQTSQRGGAVIAQALNSVFARISRAGAIEQLRELGVQIDASQSGVEKLRNIADALQTADAAQANLIRDTAGGVRNLNVLSAVLSDLRNKYSLVGRATDEAANATDEAIQRNNELNKTYDSLANRTLANIQQVSAQFGKLTIGPGLEKVLGGINLVLEGAISKNSDNAGEILGKGLLKGLGEFLGGPGLFLAGAAIFKLVARLALEAGTAFKTVLGLNKAAAERASLELNINSILSQQPKLISLALGEERELLQAVRQVNAALSQRSAYTKLRDSAVANVTAGVIANRNKGKAVGLVPEIEEKMGAYAAGYEPGDVKETNVPNLGRVIYNTAEKIKYFPGLSQPAIMPPQFSQAGGNYQKAFEKSHGFNPYRNEGLVPNFAKLLGKGSFGHFYDLEKSFQNTNIGVKRFHSSPDASYEFVINDFLQRNVNIPGVKFPKVFGSAIGSFNSKSVVKEILQGVNANNFGTYDKPNPDFTKRFGFDFYDSLNHFDNFAQNLSKHISANNPSIRPGDLHTENFFVPKEALNNILFRSYRGEKSKDIFDKFLSSGQQASVFDVGNFQALDQDIFKKYKVTNLGYPYSSSPRTQISEGLIPNYAISGRGISDSTILGRLKTGATKGSYFSDFYDRYEANNPLRGKNKDLFNKIYAGLSYGADDRLVFNNSIDIFKGIQTGRKDFTPELSQLGLQSSRKIILDKILSDQPLTSRKTSVYYDALNGNRNALAIDRNFINTSLDRSLSPGEKISVGFRERLESLVTGQLSPILGLDPRAIQASVFAGRSKFKPSFDPFMRGFDRLGASGMVPNYATRYPKQLYSYGVDTESIISRVKKFVELEKRGLSSAEIFKSTGFRTGGEADTAANDAFSRLRSIKTARSKGLFDVGYQGLVPNYANVGNILSSMKFAGQGLSKFGSGIGVKNIFGLLSGKTKIESILPSVMNFISSPRNFIANRQDLDSATNLLNTLTLNPKINEIMAHQLSTRVRTTSFEHAGLVNEFPYRDSSWGERGSLEEYAKYRLFGGQENYNSFLLKNVEKEPVQNRPYALNMATTLPSNIIYNKDRSISFAPNTIQYNSTQSAIETVLRNNSQKSVEDTTYGTKLYGNNQFVAKTHLLGRFTGRYNKAKTLATYHDRWDVALHGPEQQILNEYLTTGKDTVRKLYSDPQMSASMSGGTYGGNIDTLILRDIISKLKTSNPVTFRGVVKLRPQELGEDMLKIHKGLIPNFSPISDAIVRESQAGIPSSLIRVGKSPELTSSGNPLGLGVYNTKDEPGGLSQGIARIAAKGLDPKRAGVPNFAPLSFYQQPDFIKPGDIHDKYIIQLDKAMLELTSFIEKSGLSKSNVGTINKLKGNLTKIAEEAGLTASQMKELRRVRDIEIKYAQVLFANPPIATSQPASPGKISSFLKEPAGTGYYPSFLPGQFQKPPTQPFNFLTALTPDRYKTTPKPPIYTPYVGSFLQQSVAQLRAQEAQQKLRLQAQEAFNFSSSLPKLPPISPPASPVTPTPNIFSRVSTGTSRILQNPRAQNLALASSFILPTLAGVASESFGDRTVNQRGAGQTVQSLANIGSYAALGASSGNPYLFGVSTLAGVAFEIPRIVKAFTDVIPDLEREIEKLTENINTTNDGFSNIIQTNEKLSQYNRGELNLSPLQYGAAKVSRDAQINKLAALFPSDAGNIRKASLSGDIEQIEKVTSTIINRESQKRQLNEIQKLGQIVRPNNAFARIFSSGPKEEDVRNYTIAQLSQRSENQANKLQIPDFLLKNPELITKFEQSFNDLTAGNKLFDYQRDYKQRFSEIQEYGNRGGFRRVPSADFSPDTFNRIGSKAQLLTTQAQTKVIENLSELSKSGGYKGLEDEVSKLKDLQDKNDFTGFARLVKDLQERLNIPQLKEALTQIDKNKTIDREVNNFSLSLDKLGEGLASLSARMNILSQSNLEDMQRNLNRNIGRRQTTADIRSLQTQTNPFLSLSFQTGAANENALLTRNAQIEEANVTARDASQKNIIGVFANLRESLYNNLASSTSVDVKRLQTQFEKITSKLLPNQVIGGEFGDRTGLGDLYNNVGLSQEDIKNLPNIQRSQFDTNVKNQLSDIEKQLQNPNIEVGGLRRKLLEQERKLLQAYISSEEIAEDQRKKNISKAQKDLEATQERIKDEESKQRAQLIETLSNTYSIYVGNIKALRENAKAAYDKAKALGLEGRAAERFITFDFQKESLGDANKDYRAGLIDSDTRRQAVSSYANSELQQTGTISKGTLTDIFKSSFGYNSRDVGKDLINDMEGLRDALVNIRPAARDAFASMVDGSKNAGDAFRQFGISIATNVLNNIAKLSFDKFFGTLFSSAGGDSFGAIGRGIGNLFSPGKANGGLIGYAGGGVVTGGSGLRDDVPAMLSNGSFVIKRSSANKYGKRGLDAINYGLGFDKGGGINQILTNQYDVTGKKMGAKGSFNVDPRLSAIGQTDENNPANALKFGREQDYIGYLKEIEDYKVALKNFQAAKLQRLIGAYFSAATQIGGSFIGKGLTRSSSPEAYQAAGREYGDTSGLGDLYNYGKTGFSIGKADGGMIKRYAYGGSVDSIPALLTGGEYVMSPETVNRLGVGFMHRLNGGQVAPMRYATGGLVGRDTNAVSPVSQDATANNWQQITATLLRLVKVNEEIRDINSGAKSKVDGNKNGIIKNENTNNDTAVSPQVSIVINMSQNGNTTTQSQTGNTNNDNGKSLKEFSEMMANVALKTINDQQRDGGLLANTRRR